jgi:hypothetical protein
VASCHKQHVDEEPKVIFARDIAESETIPIGGSGICRWRLKGYIAMLDCHGLRTICDTCAEYLLCSGKEMLGIEPRS